MSLLASLLLLTSLAAAGGPTLAPTTITQGALGRVIYPVPEGRLVANAVLQVAGNTLPCFQQEDRLIALFAVPVQTPPGRQTATLLVRYADGSREHFPLGFTVASGTFPTQRIRMPKSKTGLMSSTILAKERQILYGAMKKTAAVPQWEGVFANPLEGRISSPFGRKRYVNGRFWGQHAGRDVAAPTGRPVQATNSGTVLVAQKLWMRGNTVMIDHGLGVFSLYCHLSQIGVKVGQSVRKGEVIGRVGATGFVTGPHLHWEIRVQRTPVNPAGPLREGIALGLPGGP
jgi:murein DD-endopeptidase MepM/ murein hydrolase activator NlpD